MNQIVAVVHVQSRPVDGSDPLLWSVSRLRGSAAELHALEPAPTRGIWHLEVDRPTLVLGSTQAATDVDDSALARRGVDLARRRSGGGAVLLVPGEHTWVDVVVPCGDPLWNHDVEEATWWLGDTWRSALEAAGVIGAMHTRGVTDREFGRIVCFAALGPGELSVAGQKLLGISQRRTREVARFQCVVHRRFDPDAMASLLDGAVCTDLLRAALHARVVDLDRLGVDHRWSVVEGLVAALP